MYRVRLWSVRHSRRMEWLYTTVNPLIVRLLRGVVKVFGHRLDKPITKAEALAKGFFFDCKMCGDCALSKTGMSCPMNCPKTIRNGPCGGVRDNGHCEVKPEMRCVWVAAWDGASRMRGGDAIKSANFAVDNRLKGQSTWLRLARDD